jgi:glycosyltransferase involved in cell wall biosynthesis
MRWVIAVKTMMIEPVGVAGNAWYMRNLVDGLSKIGIEVTLLTSKPNEYDGQVNFTVKDPLVQMTTPWYIKIRPIWAIDRLTRTIFNSLKTKSEIIKMNPEVVHYHFVIPIVDGFTIPKTAQRVASVITVHNVIPHRPGIEFNYDATFKIYSSVQRLLVHSRRNKTELLEQFPLLDEAKIAIVPHGVEVPKKMYPKSEARTKLGLPLQNIIILFFGIIRQNKGLETLLKSIAILNSKDPNLPITIVIAGTMPLNENFSKYEELIEQSGIFSKVITRIGFVTEEDIPVYFCACDILALPYTKNFKAQSGVLFQAYSYNLPAVVSDAGALGETVIEDGTGIVAQNNEVDSFADALEVLIRNDELRNQYQERIVNMREKYSWGKIAMQVMEVYTAAKNALLGK